MLVCSFCGKDEGEVDILLTGPGVYICDECVRLCVELLLNLKIDRATYGARGMAFSEIYGTDI